MIESRWHRRREPAVARRSRRCNARRLFLWERASGAQSRIGINSGYCNVGNFGSADRMDYTIIGAEANLAARLQSIAESGGIVISYETFALVRDVISAHSLPPITMKGISREVIPYSVDGMRIFHPRKAASWSNACQAWSSTSTRRLSGRLMLNGYGRCC